METLRGCPMLLIGITGIRRRRRRRSRRIIIILSILPI
jgi:hypothetical protein